MASKKRFVEDWAGPAPTKMEDDQFYGMTLDDDQINFVNAILDPQKLIIFCRSVAGTGKSTLAIGAANILARHGAYDGIVGIVGVYGEGKQGFLPGDITQKSEVYFEPFYQAMITCNMNPNTDVSDVSMVNQKNGSSYVTLLTHTFLRGTTLDNKVVILDEAQNNTVKDLKKILTRITDRSKVIVCGHDGQCDLTDPTQSGFIKYIEHYRGDPRCAVCELKTNYRGWISSWADALED